MNVKMQRSAKESFSLPLSPNLCNLLNDFDSGIIPLSRHKYAASDDHNVMWMLIQSDGETNDVHCGLYDTQRHRSKHFCQTHIGLVSFDVRNVSKCLWSSIGSSTGFTNPSHVMSFEAKILFKKFSKEFEIWEIWPLRNIWIGLNGHVEWGGLRDVFGAVCSFVQYMICFDYLECQNKNICFIWKSQNLSKAPGSIAELAHWAFNLISFILKIPGHKIKSTRSIKTYGVFFVLISTI